MGLWALIPFSATRILSLNSVVLLACCVRAISHVCWSYMLIFLRPASLLDSGLPRIIVSLAILMIATVAVLQFVSVVLSLMVVYCASVSTLFLVVFLGL